MKQKRKEELLWQFPKLPDKLYENMQGKGAANFCVFLTEGRELFVRCYHRYSKDGKIIERQRYVFAKDGTVRYIFDDRKGWKIATRFREPVFCSVNYGYTFDNSYRILNFEAVAKSDMKYSQLAQGENLPISYLKLYCRYPNIEYLVKSGYGHLIKEYCTGYILIDPECQVSRVKYSYIRIFSPGTDSRTADKYLYQNRRYNGTFAIDHLFTDGCIIHAEAESTT